MERPVTPQGVIFDLDGVTTDTAAVHARAWKKMFDEYLLSRQDRFGEKFREFSLTGDYRNFVDGRPRYEGVATFLASRGISLPEGNPSDPPDRETICGLGNRKNELFNTVLEKEGVKIYPSSVRLIRQLQEAGIPLAVASSSKNCKVVLEKAGLFHFFNACVGGIVSREKDLKGKPEPDIFLYAARLIHADPARAVIIEDALSGVEAGKKGGFGLVIGVARENNSNELGKGGADWIVRDLDEVTLEKITERMR